jgi:hypothetical protein
MAKLLVNRWGGGKCASLAKASQLENEGHLAL